MNATTDTDRSPNPVDLHVGGRIRMRRKHEGWDERAAHMEAELVLVRDLMTREGKADWSANFRREI